VTAPFRRQKPQFPYSKHIYFTASAIAVIAVTILAKDILLPFLLAIVVAYVLMPAVSLVERTKVPRWVAILIVYALTIGAVTGFAWAVIPRLLEETKNLSTELPKLTKQLRYQWLPAIDAKLKRWAHVDPKALEQHEEEPPPEARSAPVVIKPREDGAFEVELHEELQLKQQRDGSWTVRQRQEPKKTSFSSAKALGEALDRGIAYAQENSMELLKLGREILAGISRGIFLFFITLMLAGYIMYTHERILRFVRDMWPEDYRAAFDHFMYRVERGMAGVVRGQLLICLVNGVLSAVGFRIFDLKYWPILALVAGIMSIIPIFGSILSSIPAVAIGLTQSFGTALGVLLWIIGIHQLEANFLNPKIIGDQAKIHPVLVVFALLFGEHYFGITGALLAVPCMSLAQTIFLHFRESVLNLPSFPKSRLLAHGIDGAMVIADGAGDPVGRAPDEPRADKGDEAVGEAAREAESSDAEAPADRPINPFDTPLE